MLPMALSALRWPQHGSFAPPPVLQTHYPEFPRCSSSVLELHKVRDVVTRLPKEVGSASGLPYEMIHENLDKTQRKPSRRGSL